MHLINISAIAVALAMDAFAVAIATGVCLQDVSFRQMFRLSWPFGLFHAMLPVIGWSAGLTVRSHIERFDHWVAFGLLALVGINMIKEGVSHKGDECERKDPTRGISLVVLSVATSIDALAVGFSVSVLSISIWLPALIIGLVAGGFTIFGLQIGQRVGSVTRLSAYAEAVGGVVLLAIGVNILHEHGALPF